ncbi:helix-turn-helix transcriptional regulator [Rhodoferax koreense]|uniref:Helix-turn-helix transcriptional regulator n=1 Tax=Rhodoferax koreensis TaxID=1842727 RepID=A0A1P8K2N5_9BURK|nr:LuxR C-terminal-related transcriptional regulator [Rhodoferax koreense]APW40270.1 helix-turn-helix transcriptional regulator [Rhodoferax koreense]
MIESAVADAPCISSVLAAKLSPPVTGIAQVRRRSLVDKVAGAGAVRLTVFRAPAGFGKTTAMLQLRERLAAQGVRTAWLTLDTTDNDASRFLDCFSAVACSLVPASRGDAAPMQKVESLYALAAPFAIFLDDFEAIHETAVLALLRATIERLPRGGQVIVGSRNLPDLGLARLRAHGQLLELDAEAMRFSLEEAQAYFRLRRLPELPFEAIRRLHQKTEGWVTALWLASLSLEREGPGSDFVEQFSGSSRAVADYLAEDVLAHQPAELREFLLRTSILRSLDASVCQALMPKVDAEHLLRTLDEQHLFLVSLAGQDRSYRYHGLFSDYLRARLARELPDDLARLHLAASGWYESQHRRVPAIEHAIEGGDYPHALALLEGTVQDFLEDGRMRMLARWFDAIPASDLRAYPLLQAMSVWPVLFTRGAWEAAATLAQADLGGSTDPQVIAHVNAQGPLLLAMQDRYDEAYASGTASMAQLPTHNAFADSMLRNAMAAVLSVMGEDREAQRLIDGARRVRGGSTFNRMYAESLDGMLDFQRGRLREATARFRIAISTTHRASYDYASGNAWAGMLYAATLYEANDLNGADHLVNIYLPLACDVGLPDHMILGQVIRTRIAFHRGDVGKAFETLSALEQLGHARQLDRLVASAKLERARQLLMQGNEQAATEELERAADPAVWERIRRQRLPAHEVEYLELARIRRDIHFGDARSTLEPLEREMELAARQSRQRRLLQLRVLYSLALQRSGKPAASTEILAGVLRQASQEGFVRMFVDEGEAIGRLVHHYYAVLHETPASRSDPILVAHVQRLIESFGPMTLDSAGTPAPHALMEPLTRKEIQILQLVEQGNSNSGISEKLKLSDSTVRTHLRNVNTKLNARSRAEAVAIARRLDVIR